MSFLVFESMTEDDVATSDRGGVSGTESETVSAAVTEVAEVEGEVAREDAEMEQLSQNEEVLTELEDVVDDVVREGAALPPTTMALALAALRSITPRAHRGAIARTFNMEAVMTGISGRKQQTRLVQEGVKESLKAFWQALKNQFKKLWSKIKTWYIKTFSASKKLRDKAEKLLDKVNTMSATIENKSFAFSQVANVAIDGKAKNAASITSATRNLANLLNDVMTTRSDTTIDAIVDDLDASADKIADTLKFNKSPLGALVVLGGATGLAALLQGKTWVFSGNAKIDPKVEKALNPTEGRSNVLGGAVVFDNVYPGDWTTYVCAGFTVNANTPLEVLTDAMRSFNLGVTAVKEKPKEYDSSTEVDTLTQPQMKEILASISDGCESIFQYEKKWEKVDKQQDRLIKAIDGLVKEAESIDDTAITNKDQAIVRALGSTSTRLTKTLYRFPVALSGKAMTTFAALYNYCEQSISNYRK